MLLDLILSGNSFFDKEFLYFGSMVSLELDDLSPLVTVESVSIAMPHLLESSGNSFQIEVLWHTLHECQTLSGISLLEVQMDSVSLLHVLVLLLVGVESIEI